MAGLALEITIKKGGFLVDNSNGGGKLIDTIRIVNNCEYIVNSVACKTCEFIPPCRLCTWVSKEVFQWVYNEDIEKMLKRDRKWYLKEKRRKMRELGFKENKGRGNGSVNYGARNTTVNKEKPDIMTI